MKKWIILSTIKLDGERIKPGGKPVEISDDDLAMEYLKLDCIERAPEDAEDGDKPQRSNKKADFKKIKATDEAAKADNQ